MQYMATANIYTRVSETVTYECKININNNTIMLDISLYCSTYYNLLYSYGHCLRLIIIIIQTWLVRSKTVYHRYTKVGTRFSIVIVIFVKKKNRFCF